MSLSKNRYSKFSKKRIRKIKVPSFSSLKIKSPQFRSVALICTDLEGLVSFDDRVGGANLAIADCLSRAGHKVSIFFVSRSASLVPVFRRCKASFKKRNIELHWLEEPPMIIEGLDPARLSYAAYLYLRNQHFDVIHFQGAQGLGYYTALSKSLGLDFDKTLICIDLHGPGYWARYGNEELVAEPNDILKFYLERKSVELADVLISPSQYILHWAESEGWKLPKFKFVEQFPILMSPHNFQGGKTSKFKEIIFYGGLEIRRGIVEFCDALNLLPKNFLKQMGIKVTFLGGLGISNRINSDENYLTQVGSRWTHKWKIISNLGRAESLKYISRRDALVVIPCREDSMGYHVLECLALGVSFIASDILAFQEIIDKRDHKEVLFEPTAFAMSERIQLALSKGVKRVRFLVSPKTTSANWGTWHGKININLQKKISVSSPQPLVSICVTHRNRPAFLKQCLDSLEQQTYKKFEVILMDDASDKAEAKKYLATLKPKFRSKGWKIIIQKKKRGPSANRNQAAEYAKGKYLLFMDDDNIAMPTEVFTFVNAARISGSDILTCACDRFSGVSPPISVALKRWAPIGDLLGLGLFYNLLGDMNFFIKRKIFLSLGGLRKQNFNVGAEDAEFLVNAVLKGHSLSVVPEALYWYRYHDENLSSRVDFFQTLMKQASPYYELVRNQDLKHLMSFSLGMWYRRYYREDRWDRLFPQIKN